MKEINKLSPMDKAVIKIINTFNIQNNFGPGQTVDIEAKLLNEILVKHVSDKTPLWWYISRYGDGKSPEFQDYGMKTYVRSEFFQFARENKWEILIKKGIINSISRQRQNHVVILKDKLLIKLYKEDDYKREKQWLKTF